MYLLYLDDSGSAKNTNEDYFVLAGIAVYEAQIHFLTQELDKLALEFDPQNPRNVEFHASEIFSGRKHPWSDIKNKEERCNVIKRVNNIFSKAYQTSRAFGCAIHKDSYPNDDPVEMAFEDICSRFDLFLLRKKKQPQLRQIGV